MSVTKLTTNSFTGLEKYDSFLAGNGPVLGGSYQSIATYTGTGGATETTFSSLPSGFTHLQLRYSLVSASTGQAIQMQFNGDTTTNYVYHAVYGNGATASAANSGGAGDNRMILDEFVVGTSPTYPSVAVVDILDAFNTSKYKTIRSLNGADFNGSGAVGLNSGLWRSTSAISSIRVYTPGAINSGSKIALYGVL